MQNLINCVKASFVVMYSREKYFNFLCQLSSIKMTLYVLLCLLQLLQIYLNLCVATFAALARYSYSGDGKMANVVEAFFMEQLRFTRECVLESKVWTFDSCSMIVCLSSEFRFT